MARPSLNTVSVTVVDDEDIIRLFQGMKPSIRKATFRSAASKSATLVKKTARRLCPVGLGMNSRGQKRKHLRDALVQNTKTLKSGTVSAIVGGDYKIVPHTHLAHEGAKAVEVTTKKRSLSNVKTAGKGAAKFFGKSVKIPQRKGTPFLANALEANRSKIDAIFMDSIRKTIGKAMQ